MDIPQIRDINKSQALQPLTTAPSSFRERKLKALITLQKGEFVEGSNSLEISDLGMIAKVEKLGAPDFGKASLEIYGLRQEIMEQLSTLNMRPLFVKKNYLNIYAGDDYEGYTQIFAGSITSASADFNSAPDVKFKIEARIGFLGSVTAQGQNVVNGSQPVSNFIKRQVESVEFSFENQGVTASIKNGVFTGSPIDQARQAAAQVGCELIFDDEKAILISSGGARKNGDIPLLSADTGLLGYPVMSSNGISCKAIFNPNFKFAGLIEIKSLVPKVSGQWRIIKLSHSLASSLPNNNDWTSSITAFYPSMSGATGRFI